MARSSERRKKKTSAASAASNSTTVSTTGSDADLQKARNELLSSVEDYGSSSPCPFLRLFVSSNADSSIKAGLSPREQRQLLLDAVRSHLKKAAARRFFAGLSSMLQLVLENEDYIPESAYQDENSNDNSSQDDGILPDAKSTEHLTFLKYAAIVTRTYVETLADKHKQITPSNSTAPVPVMQEVFQLAESLHSILFILNSCGPDAIAPQSAILALCESWWLHNAQHKEHLVAQTLPLLVNRALGEDPYKQEIKRLLAMGDAFLLIDFADPDSRALKSSLLRVVSSPSCLRVPEGKKFVSHLFHVDAVLIPDLHQAMRVHIPDNKHTLLQAYGEIYYRAWKDAPHESEEQEREDGDNPQGDEEEADQRASTSIRQMIESHVLSDLVYAVIHAANPTMSKSLITVLQPFHDNKKHKDVEDLLHRLYSPILWRSLVAAHATVRLQATRVLAHVFPLQEVPHTQTDLAVRKAGTALQALIQDVDPRVRLAASQAVGQILSTYWDVMPTETIRSLLDHLVTKHASDTTSSAVRAGALDAVSLLLKAPQSHAVLRPLLPSLGNLIHDKVEGVRVAVIRLLLQIKKTPGIKYYHVVPVEHLTSRLAQEGQSSNPLNSVASSLTALMLNSYFPSGKSGEEQMKRTLTFLSTKPSAAAVFYANLSQHLPLDKVAQLAAMLLLCLQQAVQADQAKRQTKKTASKRRRQFGKKAATTTITDDDGENDDDKKNQNGQDDRPRSLDIALMASLAETICTLWESIENKVERGKECNQFLTQQFSGETLMDALAHFEAIASECKQSDDEDENSKQNQLRNDCFRARAAILCLAGRLPSKAVEGLVPYITSVFESLSEHDGPHPQKNVSPHIALLCQWDMTEEIAPSLASSIEARFESDHELFFASPDVYSKKRKSGRLNKISAPSTAASIPKLPSLVAVDVIGDILRGSDPSSVAARAAILTSNRAMTTIESALERGIKQAERLLAGDLPCTLFVRHSDVVFILRVCELYGRFGLHKEAMGEGDITISKHAERLLEWTSLRVVPKLTEKPHAEDGVPNVMTPFQDPNLSSILVEKSFEESFSSSPFLTGPPRRRANRNGTHGKESESPFTSLDEKIHSTNDVGRAFAASLMQSSCVIFSEWLAVGGAGSEEIEKHAAEWCKIFKHDTDSTNDGGSSNELDIQDVLLSTFSRLAVLLCKATKQFILLKELLVNCNESKDKESMDTMRKAVSSLLSSRGTQAEEIVTKTVECALQAAYFYLDQDESELVYELPTSAAELWSGDRHKGIVGLAWNAIFGSKPASHALGKRLADSVVASKEEPHSERRTLFHAKCLWLLCDATSNSKWSIQLVESMDKKSELCRVFDVLKDAIA